jgi:hypothetical protein
MDIQTILIFILCVLALNLIAVGIYVILVLRDFRDTIKKANAVLDNVDQVTGMVASPAVTVAGIIAGVAESVNAVKTISGLMGHKKEN